MVIELLEPETDHECIAAATHHFQQLAQDNESVNSNVEAVHELERAHLQCGLQTVDSQGCVLVGTQTVAKFNEASESSRNIVRIQLGLIRLPTVDTDVLITLNQVVGMGASSSSNTQFGSQCGHSIVSASEFESIVCQFDVNDWNLFAG